MEAGKEGKVNEVGITEDKGCRGERGGGRRRGFGRRCRVRVRVRQEDEAGEKKNGGCGRGG